MSRLGSRRYADNAGNPPAPRLSIVLAALILGFTGCTGFIGCTLPPATELPVAEDVELAVVMGEIQRHSAKLGYSLTGRNLPLASFYLDEVIEVLEGIESIDEYEGFPIRDTSRTIMTSQVEALRSALAGPDWPAAERAYEGLIDGCNRCHAATEHEFIVITPAAGEPPFNQDFQPAGRSASSSEDSNE